MESNISSEEIKWEIFNMSTLKAPRLDGFYALFFQNQWDTIKGLIKELVHRIFNNLQRISEINDTNIVLILKKS